MSSTMSLYRPRRNFDAGPGAPDHQVLPSVERAEQVWYFNRGYAIKAE